MPMPKALQACCGQAGSRSGRCVSRACRQVQAARTNRLSDWRWHRGQSWWTPSACASPLPRRGSGRHSAQALRPAALRRVLKDRRPARGSAGSSEASDHRKGAFAHPLHGLSRIVNILESNANERS
jgi:hypothetical protein